jgi:hypothetical protein
VSLRRSTSLSSRTNEGDRQAVARVHEEHQPDGGPNLRGGEARASLQWPADEAVDDEAAPPGEGLSSQRLDRSVVHGVSITPGHRR